MHEFRALISAIFAGLMLCLTGCGFDVEPPQPKEYALEGPAAVLFNIDGTLPQFTLSGGLVPSLALSQYQLEKLLDKAAQDPLAKELIIHFGTPNLSLARGEEVAQAIRQASAQGKPVTCHFDEADNATYWVAARACPRILISPAGSIELLGLGLEAIFVRELLASIGVAADIIHIGRYKDAAEPLTRDNMSEDAKEAAKHLIAELNSLFVGGIAERLKKDAQSIASIIDNGPYDADSALKVGLVDGVSTLAGFVDGLRAKYGAGVVDDYGKKPAQPFSITELLKIFSKEESKTPSAAPFIALVPAIGPISSGTADEFLGSMDMVSDMDLVKTLGELERDTAVKAVVLRIDSPGGSALASDNIWQAIRTLAAKKPVVASMGDVAASGGYYIASAATESFALPATITGSIGVVGGKIVIGDAATKLGVKTERIDTAKRASLTSPFIPFDDSSREALRQLMQRSYDLFVDRVVEGRKLEKDQVLKLAEGRVWAGTEAWKNRLVDKMGGLKDAIARARELAQLPAQIPVKMYPKQKNLMDLLGNAFAEPETMAFRTLARRRSSVRQALSLSALLLEQHVLAFAPVLFDIR